MSCSVMYVPQPSVEDILNQERNEALSRIEQELGAGTASIEADIFTGSVKVVGASVSPKGMSDLCVLDALQSRGSVEFQLAMAAAGVQDRNFSAAHAHAHAHGHKH